MKVIKGPVTKTPAAWRSVYAALKHARESTPAPVDIEGAETLADSHAPPELARFQTLVGLMLSSQTKDPVTSAAVQRLKEKGLSVAEIREMTESELSKLIYPVSFYKTKAKHIKATAEKLHEKHGDDVPDSIEELLELPGVGPKMGYLCLTLCHGKVEGIAVDTHVHRICNRLAWVKSKTPEQTRVQLQSWLPHEYWREINLTLVGWGQTVCKPIKPQCDICPAREDCPTGRATEKKTKPRT